MLTAKELLDRGQLASAVAQLNQDVRAKPGDVSLRLFLFELLCFAGDLDRADKQLDVIGHISTEMQIGAGIYRNVIAAERLRSAVFGEGALPGFLIPPPEYAAWHLEALTMIREKQPAKARALLEKSMPLHPVVSGEIDGRPFEEIEDSDPFLSPFLEVVVHNSYVWLPFEQITRIEIRKPAQLRDLIWIRAQVETHMGDLGEVFLPVLYPGTARHDSETVRLGRMTDWVDVGEGLVRGAGPRLFLIDGEERPVLEVGEIRLTVKGEENAVQAQTSGPQQ
jgi:type VI secretion system protein ImpE